MGSGSVMRIVRKLGVPSEWPFLEIELGILNDVRRVAVVGSGDASCTTDVEEVAQGSSNSMDWSPPSDSCAAAS